MASRAPRPHPLRSHRELRVWQMAMDLVVESYRIASLLPSDERFGLCAQTRRAAVSVPVNIAEGYGRFRRGEYLNQLSVARGSLTELETLFEIAERLRYVSRRQMAMAVELCDGVGRMLTRLRQSLDR